MRRAFALAATCVLAAASVPLTAASAAQTRSARAQQTYTCQASSDDMPGVGETGIGVSMDLTVPAQVQPGSTVSLRGVFAVRFPEEQRRGMEQWQVKEIDGYSDTLSSTLTVNGRKSTFRADRWQTSRHPIEDPMVIRAPITFPAYQVPANAKGKLALALPRNGSTGNISSGNPSKVAFTAIGQGYSGRDQRSYNLKMSCFVPKGSPNVVASIPIRTASAAGSSSDDSRGESGESPSRRGSETADSADANSSDSSSSDGSSSAPGASTDGKRTASSGSDRKASGANAGTAKSSRTPSSDTVAAPGSQNPNQFGAPNVAAHPVRPAAADGVRVPSRLLWLGGIGICGLALAYAAWTNYRLRLMRAEYDD